MNVIEITKKYLEENGYEGLVSQNGQCGCGLEDLAPCDESISNCEPGYKVPCGPDCPAGGGCDYHIGTEKPHLKEE